MSIAWSFFKNLEKCHGSPSDFSLAFYPECNFFTKPADSVEVFFLTGQQRAGFSCCRIAENRKSPHTTLGKEELTTLCLLLLCGLIYVIFFLWNRVSLFLRFFSFVQLHFVLCRSGKRWALLYNNCIGPFLRA